ncbi:MAG: flagellar filament capping protein FliD [Actinobacteria bacterium]|nr:flagellar filament capping protein FliD [Actinomycetota bacterium]
MTSPISGAAATPITSVDGLVSGLNTTQIIAKLMQVEARQQTALKGKVAAEQARVSALQSVNTKLAAVQSAADTLTQSSAWKAVTASSSSTAVTATATSGTATGSLTFDVTGLAKAHALTVSLPGAALAVPGSGIDVSIGGAPPTHLTLGTDDADGVVQAINDANLGVRATLITTDQGSLVQLAATAAGAASSFTVSGLSAAPAVLVQGSDAQITVGNPLAGGYTVSSPTSTFSGLIPGVTLTTSALQAGVTVSVTPNPSTIADSMQALVTAANAALTEIGNQSAYGTNGTNAPLAGTQAIRQIQQSLLGSVSSGSVDYGSYATIGIQLDSNGQLAFDRATFLSAYGADPTTTQGTVASGLAAQLKAVAAAATDPTSGSVTLTIQGANDAVRSLNDHIADWTARLGARQAALQRQFSTLEVALGRLRNQSSWLSGQLSGLANTTTGTSATSSATG